MFLNEVCKRYSLTKKAIEYYEKQGLIRPAVLDNGYRDFSQADAERLSKIAVLRRLGLSVADIRAVLEHPAKLRSIPQRQKLALETMQKKQTLMLELAADGNWDAVRSQLDLLEKRQSILERLLESFPGYFGRYAAFHFGQFLNEPIETAEQEQAFETIVDFLDHVEIEIPKALYPYFEEVTAVFSDELFQQIHSSIASAVNDTEQFIADHREDLAQYLAFQESEEFKSSQAFKFQEVMQKLYQQNGYYDVFLPAMRVLSTSYQAYHHQLLKADAVFRKRSVPQ